MAGNALGASKAAARKLGMPLDLYIAKRAAGERYCYVCRSWKHLERFYSPRRALCRDCHRVPARNTTRITDLEVRVMRELRWIGRLPYISLAKMFGRSERSVWAACNGVTKAKLPMPWEKANG